MKISVVIPAYNCARTIRMALDSVLVQTRRADEILVLDDGSTDETSSILNSYRSRIIVITQKNSGPGAARNRLCQQAQGDLVAFLDSDDLWHPEYLKNQAQLFEGCRQAAAFFVGHIDLHGYGNVAWTPNPDPDACVNLISSLDFLRRYNARPGPFNMSYCCVPKGVLTKIGPDPFQTAPAQPWAEDCYFHNRLALESPVVYFPRRLAAYRMNPGSVSWDQLRWTAGQVNAIESLANSDSMSDARYRNLFRTVLSSKRRVHAKTLLGAGRTSEARSELRASITQNLRDPASIAKSTLLLLLSYVPRMTQPKWPTTYREYGQPRTHRKAPRRNTK
jgi:glycosyltransferase involved in cell wall biosynthesis